MTEKEYWLYLSRVKGMESGRRKILLEMLGTPEEIYKAGEAVLRSIPLLEDFHIDQLLSYRSTDYEKELERFTKAGIGFVTVDEKEYPARLRDIPDAPPFLFYKGELPGKDKPAVAMVGSRKCSIYGREMCLKFSEILAAAGIEIISGMAAGVDGFAHRGAIKAGGKTYAVLGCGVDVCYPAMNRDIFDALSGKTDKGIFAEEDKKSGDEKKYGGIISEYYPGDKALPYNFPQRNRIISGLCDILLVVEAGKKSGTFITVDHALEQGREIFAIPGRIGDTVSDGCNSLIKNGAMMATEPDDIIEELKNHYEMLLTVEKKKKKTVKEKLSAEEKEVYERLQPVPIGINEISGLTGVGYEKLSVILIGLELKGLIKEVGKNLYIRI
ncbi:MAG: DNA-processing protein DprA [Lachnospiraceae bacterium]|nr:DNA-processing protein DprA [Lachnospiraceae bacterium]